MKLGHKRLSEKEFKQIKTLLGVGVKTSQVAKISGRSYGLVRDVNKYGDLFTFNHERRAKFLSWVAKHEENGVKQKETPVLPTDISDYSVRAILPLLERIASALEFMARHEHMDEKKRFKLFS